MAKLYQIGTPVRLNVFKDPEKNAGWNVVAIGDSGYVVQHCMTGERLPVLQDEIECEVAAGIVLGDR